MTSRARRRLAAIAGVLGAVVVGIAVTSALGNSGTANTSRGLLGAAHTSDSSTLNVAIPDDAATVDPLFAATPRSTEVIMNSYDPLMGYGLRTLKNGVRIWNTNAVKGLALASMKVSKDGRTWKLTVRKGVKFADGTPVTAATVAYMFKRNFGVKGSGGAFMYQFMGKIAGDASVKQTGPMTLQVRTQVPNPLLPRIFALSNSVPFDQGVVDQNKGSDGFGSTYLAKHTAGEGPYQLQSWTPGSQITLAANPDYWRGPASLKTVVMRIVPTAANRILLLKRGVVDVAENLSAEEIKQLSGAAGVKIVSVPSTNTTTLVMNVAQAPFTNVLVRRAIDEAIPYQQIMSSVYGGRAQGSKGPVPVGFPLRLQHGYPYGRQNVARAKQLLQQAHVTRLSLPLQIDSGNPDHEAVAVLIRNALSQVGINVSIQKLTPAVFASELAKRQLRFFLNDSLWWVDDPSYALTLGYTCKAFFNYGNYCNKSVDRLIAAAGQTLNKAKRASLYAKAQRQIMADAPMAWVDQPNFNLATRTNVTGYAHFPDEMVRFWYLRKH